jgi:hypothetical protein
MTLPESIFKALLGFGKDSRFVSEAGSSQNLVQSQPLPNLVTNVDGSRLPGLFDLNLIPMNVAAALVLLGNLDTSHLGLVERDVFLRGFVQKAFLTAQRLLEMVRKLEPLRFWARRK